jgi:hypothetical protein
MVIFSTNFIFNNSMTLNFNHVNHDIVMQAVHTEKVTELGELTDIILELHRLHTEASSEIEHLLTEKGTLQDSHSQQLTVMQTRYGVRT